MRKKIKILRKGERLRKTNRLIDEALDNFRRSLNGSITNKEKNEILALLVVKNKFIFPQVPKGINSKRLSLCVAETIASKNNICEELAKKFTRPQNNSPALFEMTLPIGKLVIAEARHGVYFAALFSFEANMNMVYPAMLKTAKDLEQIMNKI